MQLQLYYRKAPFKLVGAEHGDARTLHSLEMHTISHLHNHHQHCPQQSLFSPSLSSSASTLMDDEEIAWRLDVTSIYGFAIQNATGTLPHHETPVHISIQEYDIQVSQTLDPHPFPFHLQITLTSRTPGSEKAGIMLLVPLNQIVNIAVSDHGPHGQSLRFKLVPGQRMMGVIRQSVKAGEPGRMWGVNEDDPYRLCGMLRFREFVLRNAGVEEQQISAMGEWVECLRRHAQEEYFHEIQVLKEGPDGSWRILNEEDGDIEGPYTMAGIKQDSPEERAETLDGETEGSLAIAPIDITDCSMNGESVEPEKAPYFGVGDDTQLKAVPHGRGDHFGETIEDTTQSNRRDPVAQESPGIQSAYLTPCQSPDKELGGPGTSSHRSSPDADSAYAATPPRNPQTHPQTHPQNSPQQSNRQQSSRGFQLTGPNSIDCGRRFASSFPPSNPSSPTLKFGSPHDPRYSPSRFRAPNGIPVPPVNRYPPGFRKDNKFRRFPPRFHPPFIHRFPNHHVNGISKPKQQYDSYRPGSNRSAALDRRIEPFIERTGNNMRKRKKVHNERRD
jgi:hypothetical protein